MFPLILLAALALLFLGGALFQVGRAADYKARAQTGADSAAVAATRALGQELSTGLSGLLSAHTPPVAPPAPPVDPALPVVPEVVPPLPVLGDVLSGILVAPLRSEATRWADRNDNEVISVRLDIETLTVSVETRTKGALSGFGGGERGHARARAQLRVNGVCLPPAAAGGGPEIIPTCAESEQPGLVSLTVRLVD